jgi:hypothetical protein
MLKKLWKVYFLGGLILGLFGGAPADAANGVAVSSSSQQASPAKKIRPVKKKAEPVIHLSNDDIDVRRRYRVPSYPVPPAAVPAAPAPAVLSAPPVPAPVPPMQPPVSATTNTAGPLPPMPTPTPTSPTPTAPEQPAPAK